MVTGYWLLVLILLFNGCRSEITGSKPFLVRDSSSLFVFVFFVSFTFVLLKYMLKKYTVFKKYSKVLTPF